ncbi:MAG: hypothetical protein AAF621_07010 [Pseudomonadota bacterium]
MKPLGENFSDVCHLLIGNAAQFERFKIIFLFKKLARKERIMCKGCVRGYGGTVGDTLHIGDVPYNMRDTGEVYHLCHDYPLLEQQLKAHGFSIKIAFYAAELDDLYLDKNGHPSVRKPMQLIPKFDPETHLKNADYLLWSKAQKNQPIHLGALFEIKQNKNKLSLDKTTLTYMADYDKLAKDKQKLYQAAKNAISRRFLLVNSDVARQVTNFPIANAMDLALAIAPEYMPPFQVKTKSEEDVINFILEHKSITMSLQDDKANPLFLNFNLPPIQDEAAFYAFMDEYLGCYNGEFEGLNTTHIRLYKSLPMNKMNPRYRAIIYDKKLLAIGLRSIGKDHVEPIFHSAEALEPLKNIYDRLTQKLPYHYFGIDYRIILSPGAKPYFVLKAIDVLKSHDLGYISFFEKRLSEKAAAYHAKLSERYQSIFTPYIWDQLIGSVMKQALFVYPRITQMNMLNMV